MSRFFKGLGVFIAVCCVVWMGVLWRWQSTRRDIAVDDIVLYLGVLPLVVFALLLLARWAWRGAAARVAAGAATLPAGASAASAAAAAPAAVADDPARHASWQLLAAQARTAVGATLDGVMAAAAANEPRPALDPALRDADGLPVLCARVADLDTGNVEQGLQPLLPAVRQQHPQLDAGTTLLRALALLEDPLAAAVLALAPWAPALGGHAFAGDAQADDAALAPTSAALHAPYEPRVRVIAAWPAELNALERELAQRWLTDCLHQAAAGIVGPTRWRMPPPEAAGLVLSGPQLWQEADALFDALRRDGDRQDLLLLLATQSEVSPDAVQRLGDQGRLFGSAQPRGHIPGEAAAVLVLAPASWPASPSAADEPPVPHLHRSAFVQRDKAIGAPGRISHAHAGPLVRQALAAARVQGADVGAIVTDADQHTPRAAELFAAMLDALPHIDPTEDMRMLGHLCGGLGAVGTLLVVAGAAHAAARLDQPCVALSVGDERWRAALVVRPAAPPSGLPPPALPPPVLPPNFLPPTSPNPTPTP